MFKYNIGVKVIRIWYRNETVSQSMI